MDLRSVAINPVARENGARVENVPGAGTLWFEIRGVKCERAKLRRLELESALPQETINDRAAMLKADEQIERTIICEDLLIDWGDNDFPEQNGICFDGQFYTVDKAAELMAHPEIGEWLQTRCRLAANKVERATPDCESTEKN